MGLSWVSHSTLIYTSELIPCSTSSEQNYQPACMNWKILEVHIKCIWYSFRKHPFLLHRRYFFYDPHPSRISKGFVNFFKSFWSYRNPCPSPQEIPTPCVRGVWIFSRTAHLNFQKIKENHSQTRRYTFVFLEPIYILNYIFAEKYTTLQIFQVV